MRDATCMTGNRLFLTNEDNIFLFIRILWQIHYASRLKSCFKESVYTNITGRRQLPHPVDGRYWHHYSGELGVKY